MGPLLICTVILVANAFILWKIGTDDAFLNEYVRKSPKAWLWRKAFGEERAAAIIRKVFLPLGIVFWLFLLVLVGAQVVILVAGDQANADETQLVHERDGG